MKWASIGVDAAAFLWSTRACVDHDSLIVTALMGIAYLGFPVILKCFPERALHAGGDEAPRRYARIMATAAAIGLVCVLVSGAITEL
ncbi:MAG: hypothetical protein ACRYHA_27925 [Janthinobacterium lividum]